MAVTLSLTADGYITLMADGVLLILDVVDTVHAIRTIVVAVVNTAA